MALGYEILLMRLFSIIQWYHYAYMIISLALLGYGISGAVISLFRQRLLQHFQAVYLVNLYLFGLSSVGGVLLVQQFPFNPEAMLWDGWQLFWLSLAYLCLSLPFFFAANAVALSMIRYQQTIGKIYAFDLAGAGLGSLAIVLVLFVLHPFNVIYGLASLTLLIILLASKELLATPLLSHMWWKDKINLSVTLVASISIVVLIMARPDLVISPYKSLSQAMRIEGARIIQETSSPLGLLTVVENTQMPFRHVPGLSLNATSGPLPQLGLFIDGDGMSAITQFPDSLDKLAYLNQLTSALPYQLNTPGHALILGGGTGTAVLQALLNRVEKVDVVELNPQIIELLREDYADYAGRLYHRPEVSLHTTDARGFIAASTQAYDLIQFDMLDSYGPSIGGLYTLHENYLYTVDAISAYLQHLNKHGYLAITRWISLPPRDSLKLFVTVIDALHRLGIEQASRHLLLIRSWQTSTLVIKRSPLGLHEINRLRQFCAQYAFDAVFYPGISQQESNRYNKLRQDDYYLGSQALLSEQREEFIAGYKFKLQPATDEQPYFFNYFKWSSLAEIVSLRHKGGMPLLETGYLVLLFVLAQAILISLFLILLPNSILLARGPAQPAETSHTRIAIYFFSLGLAFLFIEIGFMQRFILFLHHPLYAASTVLCSFLVFAGLGSAWSKRSLGRLTAKQLSHYAIIGIAVFALVYLVLLGKLFAVLIALPLWAKIPLSVLLIAPLAFCMGMPFPNGLTRLAELAPDRVAWAWGINGCASVISAVLATLIAIQVGFTTLIITAIILYLMAGMTFPEKRSLN